MHERPPLAATDSATRVEVPSPVAGGVGSENHLAPARPVQLDARVGAPGGHRGLVAEEQRAAAALEQLAGAGVVAGVEAERLGRAPGGDEGLGDPVGRPRLVAPRPQGERHLERNRRQPQRVDARRVAGKHRAEHVGLAPVARSCGRPGHPSRGRGSRGRGRGSGRRAPSPSHAARSRSSPVGRRERLREAGRRGDLLDVIAPGSGCRRRSGARPPRGALPHVRRSRSAPRRSAPRASPGEIGAPARSRAIRPALAWLTSATGSPSRTSANVRVAGFDRACRRGAEGCGAWCFLRGSVGGGFAARGADQ